MEIRPDYLDDVQQSTDSLDILKQKVEFHKKLSKKIADSEKEVSELKKQLNKLNQEDIPNIVLSKGLSRLKLDTGETISVNEAISVKITDVDWFHKFLEQREEDDIIKTIVSLDKMPSVMLRKLYDFLNENEYPYQASKGVHPKTREKYFSTLLGVNLEDHERAEYIEQGRCMPKEALPNFCEIYIYHKTRIK